MQNIYQLCAISACHIPSLLLQLCQLLLCWKKPRRKQGGPGIFPHPWPLCVPAGAEKSGMHVSGCRQYSHEMGVVLGLYETKLATVLASSSLTMHAQGWKCCEMQPESFPGACRSWWPSKSCSCPSHPFPAHLDYSFEPGWVRKLQRLCMSFWGGWIWEGSWCGCSPAWLSTFRRKERYLPKVLGDT